MHPLWCLSKGVNVLNCIHSHFTPEKCGKPAFTRKTHGYLCIGHYRQQQESIPAKPRKPQPRWQGLVQPTDEQVINDIIASDAQAIAEGTVVVIKRGVLDPACLRVLEPPTVH